MIFFRYNMKRHREIDFCCLLQSICLVTPDHDHGGPFDCLNSISIFFSIAGHFLLFLEIYSIIWNKHLVATSTIDCGEGKEVKKIEILGFRTCLFLDLRQNVWWTQTRKTLPKAYVLTDLTKSTIWKIKQLILKPCNLLYLHSSIIYIICINVELSILFGKGQII